MAKGTGKALTDPARSRQIVKNAMHEKSPLIMAQYLKFIDKHIEGVNDIDQFDKEGNLTDKMSKSNIEKMKLANKMACKIVDKMIPNTLQVETTNAGSEPMDPQLQNAIKFLADRARAAAIMEEEDGVLSEDQALEIRTIARSDQK